ncbi:MAG: sugar phosphate isomerase/epimerase [Chloroflexota bacterium]|nr:sugar phosphate isomerase/epimerase [Chloroflexota bacterium]
MSWSAGINQWAIPGVTVREAARLAARAGFEALEPNIDEEGEVSLSTDERSARALRAAVEEEGMHIGGLSSNLYWRFPPTSDDPAVRDRAREIATRQLELAAGLGAGAVLIVPGLVGQARGGPVVRYDVAYERAREFIASLAPVAEQVGVDIGVENVWNKLLLSPTEMREFVDGIGSPRVGVYFDVGNILLYGYPEHWIEILGARIRRVHLKDFRRSTGTPGEFCEIGSGDVDWEAVGQALGSVGYDGPLTAEVMPTEAERADMPGYVSRIHGHVAGVLERMRVAAGGERVG